MKQLLAVVLGVLCAMLIACGAAQQKTSPGAAPTSVSGGANTDSMAGMGDRRAEIEQLDAAIDADFAQLGVGRPAIPPTMCIQPPCDPAPFAAAARTPGTATEPTCTPGVSDTCKDVCKLKDSICTNAGKICGIARDLGGNDRFANEKCASGNESCKAAQERCCGCV